MLDDLATDKNGLISLSYSRTMTPSCQQKGNIREVAHANC